MAEMRNLPPELLDIFSFLDSEGLWVLTRVSRGFQRIAVSHLFASYNLSTPQVHSGIIGLPGHASFLIPRIYRIHPIQKLVILRGTLPIRSLVSVLAVIPPIPHVMICPSAPTLTARQVASLIAPLCSVTDPIIFVQTDEKGGTSVFVSRSRRFPRISWEPFDTMALLRPPTATNIITGALLFVPAIFVFFFLINLYKGIAWLLLWPRWNQTAGIARDLPDPVWIHGRMNCQAVSVPEGGQVMLAMLGDTPAGSLTIGCSYSFPGWYPLRRPFPLSITQQKVFFSSLCLGDKLAYLHLNHNSGVTLGPLFDFLRRHPSIRCNCRPGAFITCNYLQLLATEVYGPSGV
ncbi:hypothetical protein B0H19DRAFT_1159764 [Mycena capillaripes]|nr:hypothetical protein B0H19DRAFT_1159764 [Mycena capillaripes]